MNIDTKRLATDPGYWGELGAPDDATHAANRHDKQPGREFRVCWYRKDQGFYFRYPESDGWEPCANGEPAHQPIIPRPQKPEVEWDGEPEGAQYFSVLPDMTTAFWRKDGEGSWQIWGPRSKAWLFDGYANDAGEPPYRLTPIRTKAQRERDETIAAAERVIEVRQGQVANSTHLEYLYDVGLLRLPETD